MTALLDAALDYARRGWPAFPLEPGGKRPLGRLVPHGLKEATTDPEQIQRWWSAEPDANIGLLTGVAFDVLDIDGPAALDALRDVMPLADDPADDPNIFGPMAATPRGWHAYVSPSGRGNAVHLASLAGVDWRGAGGYVVAPPSVKAGGGTWDWIAGRDDLQYGIDAPILPAPGWVLELLERRRGVAPVPASNVPTVSRAGRDDRYVQTALDAECGRVALAPPGTRNDSLNRAAHALGQLVGAGRLNVGDAGDALLRAAVLAGLDETEAEATIRSGLSAGIRSPRSARSAR